MKFLILLVCLFSLGSSFSKGWVFDNASQAEEWMSAIIGPAEDDDEDLARPDLLSQLLSHNNGVDPDFLSLNGDSSDTLLSRLLVGRGRFTDNKARIFSMLIEHGANIDKVLKNRVVQKGQKWAISDEFLEAGLQAVLLKNSKDSSLISDSLSEWLLGYESPALNISGGIDVNADIAVPNFPFFEDFLSRSDYRGGSKGLGLLIKYGMDVNYRFSGEYVGNSADSRRPLFVAIGGYKNISSIQVLLEAGANPNILEATGYSYEPFLSPLLHATRQRSHQDIVKLLLDFDANPNVNLGGDYASCSLFESSRFSDTLKILERYGYQTSTCR